MSTENLRRQGADAYRAYFAEPGDELTEVCAADHSDAATKALAVRVITAAAQAAGVHDTASMRAFAEGFLEQAVTGIRAQRDGPPIRLS
ncbi:hypothetical protein [Methylorubrum aminovorans]